MVGKEQTLLINVIYLITLIMFYLISYEGNYIEVIGVFVIYLDWVG